jgi:hypothetical protein
MLLSTKHPRRHWPIKVMSANIAGQAAVGRLQFVDPQVPICSTKRQQTSCALHLTLYLSGVGTLTNGKYKNRSLETLDLRHCSVAVRPVQFPTETFDIDVSSSVTAWKLTPRFLLLVWPFDPKDMQETRILLFVSASACAALLVVTKHTVSSP